MSDMQNSTNDVSSTGKREFFAPYSQLTNTQRGMVDFKALNGLITTEDGHLVKYSVKKFAKEFLGVTRDAACKAMAKVPNFWDLVSQRRKLLSGGGRLAKVHETWYLKAVKGEWQHMDSYLRNFDPNYKDPKMTVEHEAGNSWAALLNQKREQDKVIEGEVISNEVD